MPTSVLMNWSIDPDRRKNRPPSPASVARGGRAVVGFDATDASQDALAYAAGWARRVNGSLDVLYIRELCQASLIGACVATCPISTVPDCVSDLSALVAELLAGIGVSWSYHTASGGVARALREHASRIGTDAIILGRSRRLRSHVMGMSIAHRLLNSTDLIIIVVP